MKNLMVNQINIVLTISFIFEVVCSYENVSLKTENDINRHRNIDSPIAVTSDGFNTIFVGTDKRILMISPDGKVLRYDNYRRTDKTFKFINL